MGYLHEGHLSLVDLVAARTDVVAVSVFVNPLQFGPSEDLATYPRDEARDLAMLEARGAHLVFLPPLEEMYPEGPPAVRVDPGPLGHRLCGRYRPGHFSGVLTVVAKLLGLFRPDVAVFGRKDFQQEALIRRMVSDLDMGTEIVAAPIVREDDGLAMSSRNSYLDVEERVQAAVIHAGLQAALARFREGVRESEMLVGAFAEVVAAAPLLDVQYAEVVDRWSLESVEVADERAVMAVAVFCGKTRLIDNVELG